MHRTASMTAPPAFATGVATALATALTTALALGAATPARAQVGATDAAGPWRVEARTGLVEPFDDLGELDLGTGATLSAALSYRIAGGLHAYAGWGWHLLDADADIAPDGAIEETGYVLGLAFESPLGVGDWNYRVHGGVTYEHIEIEDDDGDVIEDTGHGAGVEFGAGLVVPLAGRLSLTPGVRYRRLRRDVELRGGTDSQTLAFGTVEVGLLWDF